MVRAHPIGRYWRDVGRPEVYLAAYRDLIAGRIDALADRARPVMTRSSDLPPGVIHEGSEVCDSVVGVGCDVRGRVVRSVLGPGTVVASVALVEDSVLFGDVIIEAGAQVRTAILDDEVVVGRGAVVGAAAPSNRPRDKDIVLVGRQSHISRNGVVAPRGATRARHPRLRTLPCPRGVGARQSRWGWGTAEPWGSAPGCGLRGLAV